MKDEREFKIGDMVTLDRYNHEDDTTRAMVIGFSLIPFTDRLTYVLNANGVVVTTSGISIMESKNYRPVPVSERHVKINN